MMDAKFRAFLEGLEVKKIDELMEKTPTEIKLIGSAMANKIKKLNLMIFEKDFEIKTLQCLLENKGE